MLSIKRYLEVKLPERGVPKEKAFVMVQHSWVNGKQVDDACLCNPKILQSANADNDPPGAVYFTAAEEALLGEALLLLWTRFDKLRRGPHVWSTRTHKTMMGVLEILKKLVIAFDPSAKEDTVVRQLLVQYLLNTI